MSTPGIGHGDGFAPFPALERFAVPDGPGGLFAFSAGAGQPAIVLLHGNGDEADSWRHVLVPLAAVHRVVAPDLPGFGRSKALADARLASLAGAVSGLVSALEGPVVLVGSSLGAAVASLVAAGGRERVSHLVLVGGLPPGLRSSEPGPAVRAMLEPGAGEALYTGLRDEGQSAAYASLEPYYADLRALPEADRAFLRERVWARVWSDTQRDAFFSAMRSLVGGEAGRVGDLTGLLAGLPTLLLWGGADRIVPLESAREALEALPGARLEVIEEAGHLPHQERPAAFVTRLQTFIRGGG